MNKPLNPLKRRQNWSNLTILNPSNSRGLDVNYLEIGVIEINVTEFSNIKFSDRI